MKNYQFSLAEQPKSNTLASEHISINLTAKDLARKLAAVTAYATATGGTLRTEIEAMLHKYGANRYRKEFLVVANTSAQLREFDHHKPFYKIYGEQQVAKGCYESVIRYHEHIAPIAQVLSSR